MFLGRQVTALDRLLAGPVPALTDLQSSDPFWDDDGTARLEAEEALATDCEALVTLLTRRWGPPETVDLTVHLARVLDGEAVPEPLRTLCGYVPLLHRWGVGDRWIGVGTGQQGAEQPMQLVAAVGADR